MKLNIPNYLKKQKEVKITKEELISFETEVGKRYESGEILSPIHLSKDNEDELIEIFQYVHKDDWVYSAWRNHYHALLHDLTKTIGIAADAKNFDLPLQFVVEDNNLSVHTPTDLAWNVRQDVPDDIVYYKYENGYPHHGTGTWVNF